MFSNNFLEELEQKEEDGLVTLRANHTCCPRDHSESFVLGENKSIQFFKTSNQIYKNFLGRQMPDSSRFFPPLTLTENQISFFMVYKEQIQKRKKRWTSLDVKRNLTSSFLNKKDMQKFLQQPVDLKG